MYAKLFTPTAAHIDLLVGVEELAWGTSAGPNLEASQNKIISRVSSFPQGITLATVNGEAAGSQFSFLWDWHGAIDKLGSWDEHTEGGWTNKTHNPFGNTGFMVGVGVIPKFRRIAVNHDLRWTGKFRISELLIARTLDCLFDLGAKQVIANARIPMFYTLPELSVWEYCGLRREDGKLYDPVLRFHERMGARVIKPVEYSMEDAESLDGGCWVLYEHRFQL